MSVTPVDTPKLDHLAKEVFSQVYEPNSDSYLFLDGLQQERTFLTGLDPKFCLEIGSGSGVVITFLAKLLGPNRCYFAVDINPAACTATKSTMAHNSGSNTFFENVNGDLLGNLRLEEKVDVLLFNPPYVPTGDDELGRNDLYASWAGGKRGTNTLDRLIPLLPRLIAPKGVFYLIAVAENDPREIARQVMLLGFDADIVIRRKCANELLFVLKFVKTG